MKDELHVLLLEDNPDDATYLRHRVRRSRFRTRVEISVKETLAEGLATLAAGADNLHVVLLDLNLPDSQGLDTLERLHAEFPQMPVIIVTGMRDETLANQALEMGARDYLTKGRVDADEFVRMLKLAAASRGEEGAEANPVEQALSHAARTLETIPECCNCGKVKLGEQWMEIKPGERNRLLEYLQPKLCPACLALLDS